MGTLHTSLPLLATVTTAAAPTMGKTQPYNATSGALAPTLPALSGLVDGYRLAVQKAGVDTSANVVTVTCAGADTFDSGATTLVLRVTGEIRELQVHTVASVKMWKVIGGNTPLTTLAAYVAPDGPGTALTTDTALTPGIHNLVDSTSGNRAMTLADATRKGQQTIIEKVSPDTNTVTVTLTYRGAFDQKVTLFSAHDTITLLSKSDGSWWPAGERIVPPALRPRNLPPRPPVDWVTTFQAGAGTLSASSIVGATSVTSTISIPVGTTITIDTSTNAETVVTTGDSTGTGVGPYTVPVPALTKAHASGVAVSYSHGFAASGTFTTFADDTSSFYLGSQSAHLTITPAASEGFVTSYANPARDLTGKHMIVWVQCADYANLGLCELLIGSGHLANYFRLTFPVSSPSDIPCDAGDWYAIPFSFASTAASGGAPDLTNITDWQFRASSNSSGNLDMHIGGIGVIDAPSTLFPNGVVTFTFDDNFIEQYTNARPILDKYGYPAVAYTVPERLGQAGGLFCSFDQLMSLKNQSGWEIAGHAWTINDHQGPLQNLTEDQVDWDLRNLKSWMRNVAGSDSDAFCLPQGGHNAMVNRVARRYFNTSRTTSLTSKINLPQYMNPMGLTHGGTGQSTLLADIQTTKDNGIWTIFYNHYIGNAGAGMTISDFQALVEKCHTVGVEVLTVSQVLDRLRGKPLPKAGYQTQVQADARYRLQTSLPQTLVPKVKASDQTVTNSATRVNDADLDMTGIVAGGVYKVKATLYYSASTAGDLSIKWGGTVNGGGVVFPYCARAMISTATTVSSAIDNTVRAIATPTTLGGAGAGVTVCAVVEGTLFVGTVGGDLQLTWAQATADASDAVLAKGSMLEMVRIS